jgi:uncharacterized protein involved in exopolysaccharide biosynthesis
MRNDKFAASTNDRPEHRFLLALRAHRQLFLGGCLLVFAVGAIVTLLLPKKYESSMKLMVRSDGPELAISSESNESSFRAFEPSETRVNSEIELLTSADILRQVVVNAGLDRSTLGRYESQRQSVASGGG